MPYSIRLPDGSIVANIPDDMPLSEARNRIEKSRPELAKYAEERQGFMPALKAGLERIKGEAGLVAGKTGLMSLKEAEAYKKEKEEQAARIHTPTEKGWTEAPLTKFTETLGGSLPYMAAPAAAGLASMALPLSGAAAGLAAAGASGLVSAGQFTGSNLARQMDTGKSLEAASLGKAVAAAIPQAAIDTIAGRMLPGIGKVFGAAGVKVTAETAEQIAKQSMMRVAGDYVAATGKAVTTEGLTEAAQQVLERLQAGLKIADPEARKEYFDSFIGGAVLGGAIAPAGRYMERAKIAAGPEKPVEPPAEEKVPATPQSEEKVPAKPLDELTYEELVQLRERLLQEPKSKERAGKLKEVRAELLKSDEEFTKREQASRAKAAESAFNQPDQEVLSREGLDVEALRKEAEVAEPTLRKKPEAALPEDLHPNLTLDAFGDKPGYYTWAKSKPGRAFIQTALDTAPEDRVALAGTSPAKAKVLELMFPEGEAAAPAVEPTATAPMVEPTATEPTVEPEAEPAFTEQREDIVSEETQTGFEGLDDASFATEKARVDAALAEHDATKPKGKGSKAALPAWEEARRPLASAASLAFDEQMRRNEAARAEPTVEPETEAWEDTKRYRDAQAEWDEEWAYEPDAPKFAAFTPMQQRKIADKLEARTLDEDQYQAFIDEAPEPGEAPALSRTQRTGAGLQKNEVGSIVDAIRSKWENAPDVAVVESMDDPEVPQAVRDYDQQQRATGATGEPEAFWYKGKAYFVANQMRSPTDVMRSMFHEILGHYGLRGTFGKALDPILKQVANARRAEVEAKAKEYGLDMGDEAQRLQAAEEVLANLAQTKPDISFVKRAVAAIRSWLRQNIPAFQNMKLTDAEIINDFILPARRFVDQGAKRTVAGKAAFSRKQGLKLYHGTTKANKQRIESTGRFNPEGGRRMYQYSEFGRNTVYLTKSTNSWTNPAWSEESRAVPYEASVEAELPSDANVFEVNTPADLARLAKIAGEPSAKSMMDKLFVDELQNATYLRTLSSLPDAKAIDYFVENEKDRLQRTPTKYEANIIKTLGLEQEIARIATLDDLAAVNKKLGKPGDTSRNLLTRMYDQILDAEDTLAEYDEYAKDADAVIERLKYAGIDAIDVAPGLNDKYSSLELPITSDQVIVLRPELLKVGTEKAAFSRAAQPAPQGAAYTVDPELMARAQQTMQEPKTVKEMARDSANIVKGVFTDPVGSMTALRTTIADRWATVEQRLQREVDGVRKAGSERAAGVIIARQAEDLNKLIPSFLYNGKLAVDDLTKLLKVEKLLDKDGNPINPVQIYDVLGRLAKKLNMTEQQASAYASTIMEGRRLQALITEAKTNPDIEVQIHWRKADKSIDYAKIKRAAQIYDATPEFKELANIMDEPRKALMNELIKAGWIDKETGETMRDVAYYVPFDRMTNEQLSAFGESFKKNFRDSKKRGVRGIAHVGRMPELKGAFDRPVGNVFDNYFKTLTWLSTELAKQNATTQILKDMSELGYARYLGQNRAKAKTDYVVTNFIDGVPHYFELPSQYDYVAFLDRSPPKGWFVRNMSNIAGMLRTTITANPVFAASQVVQDIQGALLLADVKNPSRFVREALGNFASLTWHELKNIPKYAKGEHAHHHAIEKFMADRGLTGEVDYTVSNPALDIQYSLGLQKRRALGSTTVGAILHGFKQITNASDLAVRKALYDDAERVTHDAMLAGTKARELINFRRRGANGLVRDLVAMVPFFNAHIQSMDILWREATGQGASITGLNRNQAKLKLMKMMGLYATFAATYAMLRNGDDDYDNMDERTKNNNWLFSGEEGGIRIPIRKDLAFVKVAIENAVDWYKRQGTAEERLAKEAIATTLAYAWENYAGGYMPVPAALKPLIENMTNYSLLTGRELVGTYQKGLDKHLQETSTTSEASKGIARFLKDTFDLEMSPILLDNALRGYFGTTGATVAGLTDMMLNPDSPDRPLHKMMAVGAFAWDKTQLTAEKGEFYDLAEKVLTAKRSYDSVKDTDPDYADKLYDKYEAEISLAPIVNSTLEQLSNIRKAVKVYKSPAAKEYMSRDEIQTALDAALEEERMIVDYIRELRAETGL